MRCDVAIVGAGAVGSFLAYHLAKNGFKTVVIEKKSYIGGKVCGGLVSPRVIELTDTEAVVREIRGADIVFPDKTWVRINGGKTYGYVIDRDAFDSQLADKAMGEGAIYKLGFNVNDIDTNLVYGPEKIEFEYLVGADGARSTVARRFNMGTVGYIHAIQGECAEWDGEAGRVKVVLDAMLTPGFFSWFIPYGSKAKIGLGSTAGGLRHKFNRFMASNNIAVENIRGGIIPIGMRRFYKGNIALIGDAAGMVKATSGGGLYLGLSAAKLLAENFDDWSKYRYVFMKKYGREIKNTLWAHRIFRRMKNTDFNMVAGYVKRDIDLVCQYGDIDYQSKVAKLLVKKHPGLLWLSRKLLV